MSPGRRRTIVLVLAALAGAGCCAVAAGSTWWSAQFADSLAGTVTTTAKGSQVLPELVPVALVALAGLGATFATRGWPRRTVGALVVVGGLVVAVRSVMAMVAAPEELHTELTRPATAIGEPQLHPLGPVLAVVGGTLIAVAGGLIIAGAGAARGMGARYLPPSSRAAATRVRDPDDPGSLWRALDAGDDPTAHEPGPAAPRPEDPAATVADPVTDTRRGRIP